MAEELYDLNDALESQLNEALAQQDAALQELDAVQRRLIFLEREFRNRGEIVPDVDSDENQLPLDVATSTDAMKYAGELLSGVVLSPGAADRCGELDAQHSSRITARRAWRALRALHDYAEAKSSGQYFGSFIQYCSEAPAGCVAFPPDDVAPTESESCLGNPTTRAARIFRVPTVVDPSGRVLMAAHVKVAGTGALTARLHFYDDTAGATGKVHVGYLGPHLPLP